MSNDSLINENKCLVQIREKCINILLLYFHGELFYIIVRYMFSRSIYLHGIYFYKNQKIQEEIFSCTNKHFNMSRAYVVNQRWNNTELYISQYWDCKKKKRFEVSRIFFMYLEALGSKPFTMYFISYIIFSWFPILPAVFVVYALGQGYRLNLNFFDVE